MKKCIIASLITLFSLQAKSQNTLILDASKDTYINTVIADQYQGQVQSFIAAAWTYGGTFGRGRSLLGFDLCPLPDNFVLVSATLHLYYDYSASHAGHTINGLNDAKLYRITSNWDESTTWASQPTYDSGSFSVIPSSSTDNQDYSIDVTGIVNDEISTSNEVDFYFMLDTEMTYRSLVFASKDHPDINVRPKLELTYYTDTAWCDTPPTPIDSIVTPAPINYTPFCEEDIHVANIFSPNGDQVNDHFELDLKCHYSSFHIEILNRWGNRVYVSKNQNFSWNAKKIGSNTEVSEGVYFYKIIARNEQGETLKSGYITIVR